MMDQFYAKPRFCCSSGLPASASFPPDDHHPNPKWGAARTFFNNRQTPYDSLPDTVSERLWFSAA